MVYHLSLRTALCLGLGLAFALAQPSAAQEGFQFGPGNALKKHGGYRKAWAVVIGINYENAKVPEAARSLVPTLRNAENDAQAIHDVLVKLYGYDPSCVVLLKGDAATKQEIEKSLNDFKDEVKVKPDDSLVVFFSGHGTRIENESDERGAIYAANVQFSTSGKLSSQGCLRMHKDLLPLLDASPAKHKLLILDCCHSGEIFSLRARSRSEADDRRSSALFDAKGSLQAIASCRDRQRASDGIGTNSPFTAALLQGLRRIPAREDNEGLRIGVNQLFTYMLPELKNLPNGQSPDCRLLDKVDGEFSFFPATTDEAKTEFAQYRTSKEEFQLLQAMVPGDHGNWWFEEMPWFVPSLRLMILEKTARERAAVRSSAINHEELHRLAEDLHRELQEQLNSLQEGEGNQLKRKLLQLRLTHFKGLLTKTAKDSKQYIAQIVEDFEKLNEEEQAALTASDLHLLAVAKHTLHQEVQVTDEVETAYKCALDRFNVTVGNELALKSLCHADYGHFLNSVKRDYAGAADQFHRALALFGSDLLPDAKAVDMMGTPVVPPEGKVATDSDMETGTRRIIAGSAPPAFRVFVLCSEAEAWQRQNRWGKANDLLNTALHVARGFDVEHELMVFVLNRVAWAQMEQWRIEEAQQHFARANSILAQLGRTTGDIGEEAATAPALTDRAASADRRRSDVRNMLSYDYNSLVRYLHHLHGLAMAKRFRGDEQGAVEDFRLIIQMTAEAMTQLKHGNSSAAATGEAEKRLLERLINSQERLADCNLFGDPGRRNLAEAADDYRRALQACASLPAGTTRNQRRMALLYRWALALALPSKVQDVDLAKSYCQEASELRKALKIRSIEVNGTLGEITEAIVAVFAEKDERPREAAAGESVPRDMVMADLTLVSKKELTALAELRATIRRQCDDLNGNLHRDQLETLLLATKVLAEEVPADDRFHLSEDSELLLYLCRLVLPKSAGEGDTRYRRQEAGHYLHPYFDTVLRTKLKMKPKHVKDLLEVQWEATRGEFFTKPQFSAPVLAVYLLDDQVHLFLDIPGGVSKCYCLEGEYLVSAVKRGGGNLESRLPLPEDLQQELGQLRTKTRTSEAPMPGTEVAAAVGHRLQLRWVDPIRGLNLPYTITADNVKKLDTSAFPFIVPAGIDSEVILPPAYQSGEYDVRKVANTK